MSRVYHLLSFQWLTNEFHKTLVNLVPRMSLLPFPWSGEVKKRDPGNEAGHGLFIAEKAAINYFKISLVK